ncbi:MAG: 16S rRNA (cytosine(1402)-N(4))-methyltransferase RsmH [Verrucomicrobiales bacterium]|nr:16S rRNA (cytosine(1402)-N(4))-methyltransferase RsmH [Verrucomicrobiales bacterium]
MAEEILHFLQPCSGKILFDGTLGGGGHARLLLEAGANVIATDRDPEAISRACTLLEPEYGGRFTAIRGNYAEAGQRLEESGLLGRLDGILLDLGVSSRQLENAQRGFSFLREGRLDMRLDPDGPLDAEAIVNTWSEKELVRILQDFGEEPAAKRIARAIITRRMQKPLRRTTELAELVASIVRQKGRTHPSTRTFQAIRMAVNDELGSLQRALEQTPAWLRPGGRLAVLTFHSLEDRLVKGYLRHHSAAELDQPNWPRPKPNPDHHFSLVVRKALAPSETEIEANPRARSCKLRVAERIPLPAGKDSN